MMNQIEMGLKMLIGVDPVPDSQGEKMCWDSMMKLKGFEAAGRKQGKHKQRIWLKISSNGLKIVDERTGVSHIN
uniref:PID domain-containing protein n=1 Tax=Monopterus albus TaxID=43700 RepID=A0A3Q3KF19_MONAL